MESEILIERTFSSWNSLSSGGNEECERFGGDWDENCWVASDDDWADVCFVGVNDSGFVEFFAKITTGPKDRTSLWDHFFRKS